MIWGTLWALMAGAGGAVVPHGWILSGRSTKVAAGRDRIGAAGEFTSGSLSGVVMKVETTNWG